MIKMIAPSLDQHFHNFTIDRAHGVYRFQTINGTLVVHRDTFLSAVQTYQEQFRCSRRAALHRAIKVQYWCADYWRRGEQVLTSYYV